MPTKREPAAMTDHAAAPTPSEEGTGTPTTRAAVLTMADGRPTVGRLIVPYMVDEKRDPIDFKAVDAAHVEDCARQGRCGVCGRKIRRGPVAFIGPDDGRTCFADPWMHPACAEIAMRQCPFLTGRRDWREAESRNEPPLATYSQGMVPMLALNWRAHRDPLGSWHFEAVGALTRLGTG